jgi:hypothetical protein
LRLNTHQQFKLAYQLGIVLLFLSLFLEWYVFQVYDARNRLIAHWSFNPLTGWTTIFSDHSAMNTLLKPEVVSMSAILPVLFIIMLILSAYSVLFKEVERVPQIDSLYWYAYIQLFLVVLVGFFLFVFPLYYLLLNDLYFPFLRVNDKDAQMTYLYSVGPGYGLLMIAFLLIFPYSYFYYHTVITFKSSRSSAKSEIDHYLQKVQDTIDFDSLIANEQVRLKTLDKSYIELDSTLLYSQKDKKKRVFP